LIKYINKKQAKYSKFIIFTTDIFKMLTLKIAPVFESSWKNAPAFLE